MVEDKTELKSAVAKEALSELLGRADVEKSMIEDRLAGNIGITEYERQMLFCNAAKIYHDMLCQAHITANDLELQTLRFQVGLEQLYADMEDI